MSSAFFFHRTAGSLAVAAAMLAMGNGYPAWAWAYLGYSALNAISAWLILSRRV